MYLKKIYLQHNIDHAHSFLFPGPWMEKENNEKVIFETKMLVGVCTSILYSLL